MSEKIQSLYERIQQVRQADGSLPEDFSLRPMAENGVRFADGAMDGTGPVSFRANKVTGYQCPLPGPDDGFRGEIYRGIQRTHYAFFYGFNHATAYR